MLDFLTRHRILEDSVQKEKKNVVAYFPTRTKKNKSTNYLVRI